MNKQKLASTIWESANEMRSKIEANEYRISSLDSFFINTSLRARYAFSVQNK